MKGKKKEEADRRRYGKIILKSEQEWTLPAQLGQPKIGQGGKGIVANSSLVSRRPSKIML